MAENFTFIENIYKELNSSISQHDGEDVIGWFKELPKEKQQSGEYFKFSLIDTNHWDEEIQMQCQLKLDRVPRFKELLKPGIPLIVTSKSFSDKYGIAICFVENIQPLERHIDKLPESKRRYYLERQKTPRKAKEELKLVEEDVEDSVEVVESEHLEIVERKIVLRPQDQESAKYSDKVIKAISDLAKRFDHEIEISE